MLGLTSAGSRKEFTSGLIQVGGRIQFLAVVKLMSVSLALSLGLVSTSRSLAHVALTLSVKQIFSCKCHFCFDPLGLLLLLAGEISGFKRGL